MSSKVHGIVAHGLTTFDQVAALPDRLAGISELAWRVAELYWQQQAERDFTAWQMRTVGPSSQTTPRLDWERAKGLVLFGPGQMHLVVGLRAVHVGTVAKWWVAVERPALFEAVKDFVSALARVTQSKSLIIHRENDLLVDAVVDGKGFVEIEAMIRASGSLPVARLVDLVNSPDVPIGMTSYYREDLRE